ncbi:uncharacterized protein LOC136036364 isoform X1 [Artemia franciscana]|uniref:uncharacterized protein LOC136036364 isoform X1 n=1 Tax=Artemia franciscana TaxID=6661 RepID=UPI0032DBE0A2
MGDSNKKQLTVDDVPDVFETLRGEKGSKSAMGDCNTKQLPVDDVPDVFETLRGEKGSKSAMGDCNTKQLPVDDVPDVFETLRGENGSKITQKIHSPAAQAFSKSILPIQLRDKSHDIWLHPSVKFLSDSVGDASVLLTTQNSGSNEGHVESHSIDTKEFSDVIQEIRFPTEKLRDSTDQANLLRVVNTQETEAEVTCGTMQAAFGNSALPNAPPKWFLEYMEGFKRELIKKSLSRLDIIEDKHEDKPENVVAIDNPAGGSKETTTMNEKERNYFHKIVEQDTLTSETEMKDYIPAEGAKGRGGKGRKRKAKKDPNAPKRPLSAYSWFCKDERSKIDLGVPLQRGTGGAVKEFRRRWTETNKNAKKMYEEMASKDKKRYKVEIAAYKKKLAAPAKYGAAAEAPF